MSEYIIDLAAHNASAAMALCNGVHQEIVRCRDCRWLDDSEWERWDNILAEMYGDPPLYCEAPQWSTASPMPPHEVKPDGFCAWACRRDEERRER